MQWRWGIFVFLFAATVARAQGGDATARREAREHYRKGSVAYELGHYDAAITEYEAAYRAFNEPTLLYNLGQAHRLAKHHSEALHFYKMYLIKVPDAPNRADVESRIAALQVAIDHERPAVPTSPPVEEHPSISPPVAAPSPPVAPVVRPTTVPGRAAPVDRATNGRALRNGGIVVAVAGLALVGGGVGAGIVAKNAGDDLSRADASHQPYDPSKYSTYHGGQIATGVLIGVGAAALVAGTTMAIVGARRDRRVSTVQVTPLLSPSHVGASALVAF